MKPIIRQETIEDYPAVFKLIEKAFNTDELSDNTEHFLVERLRKSTSFIPELSMVAEINGQIVGHILLTKIKINNVTNSFDSLALAPVSVLSEFQQQGIGGALIKSAHQKARELGHHSIVILGHENYYPRFGYLPADTFGISLPFDVPKENCMAIELTNNSLSQVNGVVEYDKAFFE